MVGKTFKGLTDELLALADRARSSRARPARRGPRRVRAARAGRRDRPRRRADARPATRAAWRCASPGSSGYRARQGPRGRRPHHHRPGDAGRLLERLRPSVGGSAGVAAGGAARTGGSCTSGSSAGLGAGRPERAGAPARSCPLRPCEAAGLPGLARGVQLALGHAARAVALAVAASRRRRWRGAPEAAAGRPCRAWSRRLTPSSRRPGRSALVAALDAGERDADRLATRGHAWPARSARGDAARAASCGDVLLLLGGHEGDHDARRRRPGRCGRSGGRSPCRSAGGSKCTTQATPSTWMPRAATSVATSACTSPRPNGGEGPLALGLASGRRGWPRRARRAARAAWRGGRRRAWCGRTRWSGRARSTIGGARWTRSALATRSRSGGVTSPGSSSDGDLVADRVASGSRGRARRRRRRAWPRTAASGGRRA